MTASCVYQGRVQHRRLAPVAHSFEYRLFMLYLDLEEQPSAIEQHPLWGFERPALASFQSRDHLAPAEPGATAGARAAGGDPGTAAGAAELANRVRDLVAARCGERPAGPVRLLTHLRYFGYCFNPVSFYYCFSDQTTLAAVVAEVDNTPWGERHVYVLPIQEATRCGGLLRYRFAKEFHVSPFMPLEQEYDWRFRAPGQSLSVHMENWQRGQLQLAASMVLERREICRDELSRLLLVHPLMTAKVVGAIYWNALRLWLAGAPYFPHPHRLRTAPPGGAGAGESQRVSA